MLKTIAWLVSNDYCNRIKLQIKSKGTLNTIADVKILDNDIE